MSRRKQKKDPKYADCAQCGKRIELKRFWQKFCGVNCRVGFHRLIREEAARKQEEELATLRERVKLLEGLAP